MAVTYEPIQTVTVSNSTTATIDFTSIPSTYTDLVLILNGSQEGGTNAAIRFNGDTATNYSDTFMYGSGTTAASARDTNKTSVTLNYVDTTGSRSMTRVMIFNYANTTTFKTFLYRRDDTFNATLAGVGLWRKTPEAITSITLLLLTGSTYFTSGTTATLYGIKAA